MTRFGASHNLRLYGEIEALGETAPNAAHLQDEFNYALIRDLRQWGGDNLDLWLVSDPSTTDRVALNVIARRKLTNEQLRTARDFRSTLRPLECGDH